MPKSIPPAELAGTAEVLELTGLTRRGLKYLRDRALFPAPVHEVRATPLWDMRAVRAWHAKRLKVAPGENAHA